MKSTAALFFLGISPFLALFLAASGQQPVTPPGPVQVVVPPSVAPTPAPPEVEPEPDTLELPDFEITATIGGEVIGDPVVSLPAERMLTLIVTGKSVAGEQKPVVTWSLNQPSSDISIEYDGHKVNFCGPNGSVWLFQACVNSTDPKAGPFVAQRWVVVGKAPQPPPVVVDPDEPPIVQPPVIPPTTEPMAVTYVYEKDDGPIPPAVLSGLNRLNREKKIVATLFEDDSTDGDDDVPDQYKTALRAAKELGLPALIVTAGDRVLWQLKSPQTEEQVIRSVP